MTSIVNHFSVLKKAAPNLSRHVFTCRHCNKGILPSGLKAGDQNASPIIQSFRLSNRRTASTSAAAGSRSLEGSSTLGKPSPLGLLSKTINKNFPEAEISPKPSSYFPETSDRAVAYWLLGSAASVFGIVVFGGLTRLTESG